MASRKSKQLDYMSNYRERQKKIGKPQRRDVAEAALVIITRAMIDESRDEKSRHVAERTLQIQLEARGYNKRQVAIRIRQILDKATGANSEMI